MILKLKINYRSILYIIAFFFLFKLQYYSYIPGFTSIFNLGLFTVTAYALAQCIISHSLSIMLLNIFAIGFFPLLIGVLSGQYSGLPIDVMQMISIAILLDFGLKKDFDSCFGAFALFLEMYAYINFFSIVLFPDGLFHPGVYDGNYWFLGYKNGMVRFLLPAVCVNAIWCVYKNKRYTPRLMLLVLISLMTQVLVDCKTGLVGMGVAVLILVLFSRSKMPKWVNARNVIISIVIVSILLASTPIIDVFSSFLDSMDETVSIYSRTKVWNTAIQLIYRSPLWGYGLRSTEGFRILLSTSAGFADFSHPHNFILYVLIQGGLIQLFLVSYLFFNMSKKCVRNRDNFAGKMLIAIYIGFFIMGVTESLIGADMLYTLPVITNYVLNRDIRYVKSQKPYSYFRKRLRTE